MSTLIISDTHFTPQFDAHFCAQLTRLIESHDHVVLNGDFWDGYRATFESFLRSPWQALFRPLLERHAIYIYGNHDSSEMCTADTGRFSVRQLATYELHAGGQTFVIEHGHRLTQHLFARASQWLPTALSRFLYSSYMVLMAQPSSVRSWLLRQEEQRNLAGDRAIRQFLDAHPNASDTWLVTGHTHIPRLAHGQRYANSGRCGGKHPTYLVVHDDGDIELGKLA